MDLKTILDALDKLVSLEIVTSVGDVKYKNNKFEIAFDANPKVLYSKIDLLQGDITTVMNKDYVSGDYQALRTFHEEQITRGQDIIKQNIEAAKALASALKKELKE